MVFEKVVEIVKEQLGLESDASIERGTSLLKDLEADSLDAVEVIMGLEEAFDIEIPDEAAEQFQNIGDIADYVEAQIK